MTVAAFDFDGTISKHDAVVSFSLLLLGRPRLALTFALNAHHGAAALRDRNKRDVFKAALARAAFKDRSVEEVEGIALQFADQHMSTLRESMLERIEWHRDKGHRIVLASASFEQYLQPIAIQLKIDHVIGTRLEIRDGVYTGELDGPNMRSRAKANAVRSFAGDEELWAYGNSSDDYPMFEVAQHPFLVDKSGKLQEWIR